MTARTQYRLCLAAFGLLCVAPTAAVALWCAAACWPSRIEAEAQRLSRQTGLQVSLGGFESPRPGTLRYRNVFLADPETGEKLLECPLVEVRTTQAKDAQGNSQTARVLQAAQAEIAAGGLKRLFRVPMTMLAAAPGAMDEELRITLDALVIRDEKKSHTLEEVRTVIGPLSGGAHAQAVFRVKDAAMQEPARVRIVRNRQAAPPVTGFEIDTSGGAIPCDLLALAFDAWTGVADARFRGYLWANESAAGWKGEMLGQLSGVDLGALTKDWPCARVTGTGEVSIQSLRFLDGRIEEAAGSLFAGSGWLSRDLFESAAARLKLPRSVPIPPGETVNFRQLALGWAIDKSGVRLLGRCDCGAPGTILSDGRNPLLSEPLLQPQPLSALIQTLAPPAAAPVPATREAEWLLRRLPCIEEPAPPAQAAAASGLFKGR